MQADAEVYDPDGDGTKLSADDTELTTPDERRPCGQEQRQWNGSTPYTSGYACMWLVGRVVNVIAGLHACRH